MSTFSCYEKFPVNLIWIYAFGIEGLSNLLIDSRKKRSDRLSARTRKVLVLYVYYLFLSTFVLLRTSRLFFSFSFFLFFRAHVLDWIPKKWKGRTVWVRVLEKYSYFTCTTFSSCFSATFTSEISKHTKITIIGLLPFLFYMWYHMIPVLYKPVPVPYQAPQVVSNSPNVWTSHLKVAILVAMYIHSCA